MKTNIAIAMIAFLSLVAGCSPPTSPVTDKSTSTADAGKILLTLEVGSLPVTLDQAKKTGAITLPSNIDMTKALVKATLVAGATAKIGSKDLVAEGLIMDVTGGFLLVVTSGASADNFVVSVTKAADGTTPVVPGTTFAVYYNGNGGTGTLADGTSYASGTTVTTKASTFVYTGYNFTGWNTKADGSGTSYAAGATFAITVNTTLYAAWASSTTPVATTLHVKSGSKLSLATDGSLKVNPSLSGKNFTKTGSGKLTGKVSADGSLTDPVEGNVKISIGMAPINLWIMGFWMDGGSSVGPSDYTVITVGSDGLVTAQNWQDAATPVKVGDAY